MPNFSHRFEVGQKLLCFEPDSSKAKLIYFAKILKHVNRQDSEIPHYGVHFHGWKCKWDREVPEDLLLENNEFNRMLKRKIDEVARYVRGRYERKQRIDMILEGAAICGDEINWDNLPGVWKGCKSVRSHTRVKNSTSDLNSMSESNLQENVFNYDALFTSTLDQDDLTQFQFEQLQIHKPFATSVVLSKNLDAILKSHSNSCRELPRVNVAKKFHYWCSVLQLLQSYVDGFPYSGLNISNLPHSRNANGSFISDRVLRIMSPLYARSDQNRLLCADVCSSLRVLFDFTLRDYLLLPNEKIQTNESNSHVLLFRNGQAFDVNFSHGPTQIDSVYRFSSPRYELLPDSEAKLTPDIPCLNYPPHFLLRLFTILPPLIDSLQLTSCRRTLVYRHLNLFLDYLDRTRDYWFGNTSWEKTEEIQAPSRSDASIFKTSSESSGDTEPLRNQDLSRRSVRSNLRSNLSVKPEPSSIITTRLNQSSVVCSSNPKTSVNHFKTRLFINSESSSNSTVPLTKSSSPPSSTSSNTNLSETVTTKLTTRSSKSIHDTMKTTSQVMNNDKSSTSLPSVRVTRSSVRLSELNSRPNLRSQTMKRLSVLKKK